MQEGRESVSAMTRIQHQLQLLMSKMKSQECEQILIRKTLRDHKEDLDNAASIIDLEAASLLLSNIPQKLLARTAKKLELSLEDKAGKADLEARLSAESTARRRAIKTLEMKVGSLSSRFQGAVESNSMEFAKNIRQELGVGATRKKIVSDMAAIIERLEKLESRNVGYSSRMHERAHAHMQKQERFEQQKQQSKANVLDGTSDSRKSDNLEDEIDFSVLQLQSSDSDSGEDNEGANSESNGSSEISRVRELADQRHVMFLTLQEQVLGILEKQRSTDAKIEEILQQQRSVECWRKNKLEPELQQLKSKLNCLTHDLVEMKKNTESAAQDNDNISQLSRQLDLVCRDVDLLREGLRNRTKDLSGTILQSGVEMKREVASLADDLQSCKTSIIDLEVANGNLIEHQTAASTKISELWELAHKTSVDLQAAERRTAKMNIASGTFLTQISAPAPNPPHGERIAKWRQKNIMMRPSMHALQRRKTQAKMQARPKSAVVRGRTHRRIVSPKKTLTQWGGRSWALNVSDGRHE